MRALFTLVLATALCGCAGYRLGPTNGEIAGSRSISVEPFKNDTMEPRVTDYVNLELRKRVQQDGTFRLETQGEGDIIVKGRITKFDRSALAFNPTDVVTPQDYTLIMVAEVTAIERSTGKTNLNHLVSGRTTIRVGLDFVSAERQAIPLLAEDLVCNVVVNFADGSW